MNRRWLSWGKTAALAAGLLAAAMAAHSQPVLLKWGHVYEPESIFHQQAEQAARKIAEQSQGQIKVEVVPAAKLGRESDFPLMLANDAVQIAFIAQAALADTHPPLRLGNYPFAIRDLEHLRKYLDSQLLAELMKGYGERSGNQLAATVYRGARYVSADRPLQKPEDFQGLRVYVPEAASYRLFVTALDAKPVDPPYGSLRDALRKKTEADALEGPLAVLRSQKLYEVHKHLLLSAHSYDTLGIVIGKAAWARLSAAQQALVHKALADAGRWINVAVIAGELQDQQFLRDQGMTLAQADRKLFLERVMKRSTPEQMGVRPGDFARLQSLASGAP